MRILQFPASRAEDLDSLLPAVVNELARKRGLDSRWIAPMTVAEREAIAAHWRGGSARRLVPLVDVVLRNREFRTLSH